MVRNPLTPGQVEAGRHVGQLLRSARTSGDLTLAEVAHAARLSPETLRKIETGRLPSPAFGTVVSLCTVLRLDVTTVADAWSRCIDRTDHGGAVAMSTVRTAV